MSNVFFRLSLRLNTNISDIWLITVTCYIPMPLIQEHVYWTVNQIYCSHILGVRSFGI